MSRAHRREKRGGRNVRCSRDGEVAELSRHTGVGSPQADRRRRRIPGCTIGCTAEGVKAKVRVPLVVSVESLADVFGTKL